MGMKEDVILSTEAFTKNSDGSWTSIHVTDIQIPIGAIRIPPGMTFRAGKTLDGVDLVEVLERTVNNNQ
jgi:hypothetical protein